MNPIVVDCLCIYAEILILNLHEYSLVSLRTPITDVILDIIFRLFVILFTHGYTETMCNCVTGLHFQSYTALERSPKEGLSGKWNELFHRLDACLVAQQTVLKIWKKRSFSCTCTPCFSGHFRGKPELAGCQLQFLPPFLSNKNMWIIGSFFTDHVPFLSPNQQCQCTERQRTITCVPPVMTGFIYEVVQAEGLSQVDVKHDRLWVQ